MYITRVLLPLISLPFLALGQNLSSTNGIGSTPQERHFVTAQQAQTIIAAAAANATAIQIPQNIAVVDPSGLLVAFLRQDNAYIGSIDISMKKARTAVLFNGLSSGGLFPIYLNGYLIGGVGVSGGTVSQDEEVATAGVLGLGALTSAS
ncbi:hypothetical protein BDV96DRAFT_651347 [Lophiotrema nucula]|uniref:DUF336-domain-containing protein n=1 Tax=Lophiotrema nucula TaxID=690887 RepID=A0A6A5YSS8_9PLEO|nr:hypothetical protein BDV96DRAFT_651347 [Lophiotrema nucula]